MPLADLLLKHEGLKLSAYRDSAGWWTIGVGRLIDSRKNGGISREEALYLLENDINKFTALARSNFPWFDDLDQVRKDVVVNMIFNLGLEGFSKFERTIDAIENRNYEAAAKFMLESRWAEQVKGRAIELSRMMESGKYP